MLTNEQFDKTRRLALNLAGIELCDRHRVLLARRSERLGIQQNPGLDALIHAAEQGEREATRTLVGMLTTNFTSFFRHPGHFRLAANHAQSVVSRRGHARLWSAAAATGEEPYSLAMAVLDTFEVENPAVEILATDIDIDALAFARRGEYAETSLKELSCQQIERFFDPNLETRRWGVVDSVRDLIEFRDLNLVDVVWPVGGPFDVILCRNVLMYLEAACRYSVLERMASFLAADGVLILDPVEYLGHAWPLFSPGQEGVYSLRSNSQADIPGHGFMQMSSKR